ncbi:DUF3017 domain-containing protein [Streptosporangiaceae bacterium NEAU-GS5]|nr:DUF3017 domain-containing protein [Streptosporangiaceae bacterium NEAU-GS5]
MAGVVAGFCVLAIGVDTWVGGVVIGVSLLVGAWLRLSMAAGPLASRSRRADALGLATLGALVTLGSLSLLLQLHQGA